MKRVKFQGKEYVELGGVLATEENYSHGKPAYASIFNGKVYRFGEVIGAERQIEVIEENIDVPIAKDAMNNLLNGFLLGLGDDDV